MILCRLLFFSLILVRSKPDQQFVFIMILSSAAVAVSLFSSNIGPAQPFCFGEYDVIPPLCALDNSSTKGKVCRYAYRLFLDCSLLPDASIGNMPSYKAARSSQMLLLVR